MPDQKVHGNKATLTNLKGPLSGIVNIHLNRNVTVKGQSQQTFNVNAINKDEVISMLASNGGPVLKVSPKNTNRWQMISLLLHTMAIIFTRINSLNRPNI